MRKFALIAAGLAAIAAPASAGTAVFANNPYPTQQTITPFGPTEDGGTETYGQVFVSPRAGTLDSFSFTLTGSVGKVWAGVGTWNGGFNYTQTGGSPMTLWESEWVDSTAGTMTFTPGVHINDLTKYVAYLSVWGVPGDPQNTTGLVLGDNDQWTHRYFVFGNGDVNPSGSGEWNNYLLDQGDALFSFAVTSVPEPAQWAMFIGGFGLLGAVARRRRSGLALAA